MTGPGDPPPRLASRYTFTDWAAAWKRQPADVRWLLGPILEEGTTNALFGRADVGKSLLTLDWALTLVRDGRIVIYVDDENQEVLVVERLQDMGADPGELGRLRLLSFGGLPPLDGQAGGAHLLDLAEAEAADLVILDTTSRMIHGRENDADTFHALYRYSLMPLKARGITSLRLDHPGKDEGRGPRGSSAKEGDVDTVWHLTSTPRAGRFRMTRTRNRTGHAPGSSELELIRMTGPLRHVWSAPDQTDLSGLAGQLDRLGVPWSAGRDSCRTALREQGITASNDLLTAVVRYRKTRPDSYADSRTASEGVSDCPPHPHTRSVGGGQVGTHPSGQRWLWPVESIGEAENQDPDGDGA